jgi:hypothetical protein
LLNEHHRSGKTRTGASRLGATALIAALHIGAVSVLWVAEPWRMLPKAMPAERLTWLVLPPVEDAPKKDVTVPKAAPRSVPKPQRDPQVAPLAPPREDGLTALRSYVWCGEAERSGDPLKPCDKVRWELQKGPLALLPPDDKARAQTRQFERALAVEKAPVLLPCAAGMGVSLICIAQRVVNGFDFSMASYADMPAKKTCDLLNPQSEPCARIYASRPQGPINWRR